MIYQLVVNYLSAIINNPQFSFNSFLVSLYILFCVIIARVTYTQSQIEPRCYLQLLQIWNELVDFLLQINWSIFVCLD